MMLEHILCKSYTPPSKSSRYGLLPAPVASPSYFHRPQFRTYINTQLFKDSKNHFAVRMYGCTPLIFLWSLDFGEENLEAM